MGDRFGEKKYDVEDIARSLDDQGPYQNVFMQEMDVHNVLLAEIVRSLNELKLGFAGELTMSDAMEALLNALYMDAIPASWAKRAWPSKRGLVSWLSNFTQRLNQLDEWSGNPMEIPKVTWLSGLVNPQSFLTAINQVAAQKDKSELDKLVSLTDVTKKMTPEEVGGGVGESAVAGHSWPVLPAKMVFIGLKRVIWVFHEGLLRLGRCLLHAHDTARPGLVSSVAAFQILSIDDEPQCLEVSLPRTHHGHNCQQKKGKELHCRFLDDR